VHITDWRLERSWMHLGMGVGVSRKMRGMGGKAGSGVDLFSSLEHGN
jgi:hypothetical protein